MYYLLIATIMLSNRDPKYISDITQKTCIWLMSLQNSSDPNWARLILTTLLHASVVRSGPARHF